MKLSYHLCELLAKIGYDTMNNKSELTICLRQEAAKWACVLDCDECKVKANLKLESYYEDPVNYR